LRCFKFTGSKAENYSKRLTFSAAKKIVSESVSTRFIQPAFRFLSIPSINFPVSFRVSLPPRGQIAAFPGPIFFCFRNCPIISAIFSRTSILPEMKPLFFLIVFIGQALPSMIMSFISGAANTLLDKNSFSLTDGKIIYLFFPCHNPQKHILRTLSTGTVIEAVHLL